MRLARSSKRGSSGSVARPPKRFSQRCSIRVSFTRNASKGQWWEHGRYLSRDSALKPGAEPELGFDAETSNIDIPSKLNEWQASGDERLWRFIISPEFGERLDLTKLTRDLMARIESDAGRSLDWVGIAHFNTEHPHVPCRASRARPGGERSAVRAGLHPQRSPRTYARGSSGSGRRLSHPIIRTDFCSRYRN
jgi:hypothetical protein